ncbi:MAG: 4Fe-4S binding protein [Desulfarculales bacterium]|jgi:2-oxoglutarate ferredoxin oxidoreductase subunit delta|nr:4Fe-4S binding protein [Desulfarculales bacterium]
MARLVFREDRCKGCGLCIEACPKKILIFSDRLNQKGYNLAVCSDEATCIGCAICARSCPDIAIEVYK